MQIIKQIKTNKILKSPTEIQKICLDKLRLNPLPNVKSEFWRLSNKSKFSNSLDYPLNFKNKNFEIPYQNNSQNTIRLVIGEDSFSDIEHKNYSVKKVNNNEIQKYLKKNISKFDENENWSDLLNLCLSSEKIYWV